MSLVYGEARCRAEQARTRLPRPLPNGPAFLARYWDFLGVLLLVLASFPTVWLAPRTVTFVPNYGLMDDNWHLDASFKALRGIWVGRDVAFTHGPLFQFLSSIPARSMPLSVGGLYATWNTVPIWCAFLFAYLALRLLLPEQPRLEALRPVLLLCSFWETSLRTTFPVLLFALFLRGWYAVKDGRLRGLRLWNWQRFAMGNRFSHRRRYRSVCDRRVVYSVLRYCGGNTQRKVSGQAAVHAAGVLVGGRACFAIVINSVMASPFDFRFWRDSMAQVAAYRWATPAAMTAMGEVHLLSALLIGIVIFLVRARTRKGDRAMTQRTGFLLGGFSLDWRCCKAR